MFKSFLIPSSVLSAALFEGEGDGAGGAGTGGAATGSGAGGAGSAANANTGATGGAGTGTNTNFTQDQVNAMLAKERRAFTDRIDNMTKNLQMTAEERKTLETQLEELRGQNLTEKEKLTQALEKLRKDSSTQLQDVTKSVDVWKNRFNDSTIRTALTQASSLNDAYNPTQVEAILKPRARCAEVLGPDNKTVIDFAVKVKVASKDSNGNDIELDLSPDEAVKALKENPSFANLFKGTQVAGLGTNNGSRTKLGPKDMKNMSQEEYLKNRKEILAGTRR